MATSKGKKGREIEVNVQDLKSFDDSGKEIPHSFEGTVVILVKPYRERMKYAQEVAAVKDEDAMSMADKFFDLAEENVVSVDVAMGKEKFKSLEDLGYYKEGADLINRIATAIASGPSLGN